MSFIGKRALVTGGSRGIGRGIVKALCNEGAVVYALGKQQEHLDELKAELPEVNTVQADLEDWDATRKAIEDIGDIDLLVNNAAFGITPVAFVDYEKHLLDKFIDINLKAPFNVSQIAARNMIQRGYEGVIINISTIASITTMNGNAPYCITKAGLDMLTKVMALELGPHKIRVNSVNPTITMTDMGKRYWTTEKMAPWLARTPLGKFDEVEDVVSATMFLLSDKASMITGTILPVDGGYLVS